MIFHKRYHTHTDIYMYKYMYYASHDIYIYVCIELFFIHILLHISIYIFYTHTAPDEHTQLPQKVMLPTASPGRGVVVHPLRCESGHHSFH